ncbi:MAG: cation transporter [Planctomyces sp.]|nr:cation transporter [Planctomyces sp.]
MTAAASNHRGHSHTREASRRNLAIALGLTAGYMVVELVGGIMANSLSLLADAGHMVTDAGAIGLALLAMWVAGRPASIERTFGWHRTEVLAALANALGLWLIAGLIFFEGYRRFLDPPSVNGSLMLVVGGIGLLVNLAAAAVLHRSAKESLNVEGAFLHVISDVLGSIAVIGAGLLILTTEWVLGDPIFGGIIGLLIVISSARLLWKVLHVLMEGTPTHLDLHGLCQRLEQLDGITGVHDIHAWSITTGYDALSAHVTADMATLSSPGQVLERLRNIASQEFGISHVTIQLEDSEDGCVEDHHIAHPG